ncbi:aldo/keto reductase [Phenylobacterium immobile]|uniref:aldo/keto reductase n=1 Tax=Phenylobacterium immobile TaxID=21 RepID=UPI000AB8A3EF|nr:aldo/keto reductase [Phenylobacterium immobile]
MQYARLGESGLIVSRIALGTMTFILKEENARIPGLAKVGQDMADDMVARSLDAGVNFFNSADVYSSGESEVMLGKALGVRRKDAVIATKLANRMEPNLISVGLSRRWIVRAAEESLKRLGTDYIDVYLFHKIDPYTPMEETLAAVEQLVKDGKVRYVGFSNWPAWMTAKAVEIQKQRQYTPFTAGEVYYSLVGRDVENDTVPQALDAGIGLTPWSPLAGGLLSGKYAAGESGRLNTFEIAPVDPQVADATIIALKQVAEARGATPAQVAIAWLLTKPAVSSVIIGANKPQQLDDNIAAADVQLTAEDIARLEAASPAAKPFPIWMMARGRDPKIVEALGY